MKPGQTLRGYKLLDVIAIPEDIPEIGLRAGAEGAVVDILPDGTLVVDVVDEDGYTLDMIDIAVDPKPRVVGRWRVGEG